MTAIESTYTAGLHLLRLALPLLSGGTGKLATGIRGRRRSVARFEAWAREHRDRTRPLVWFHAPSVGEGFQARAVMAELRIARPDVQIAYSFFSPSAERFAQSAPADVADYLPLDLPFLVRRLFDALAPSAIAFSKTEVWPNVTSEAKRRRVPAVLLSATLPASSSRLRAPARILLSPAHARLERVAAIAEEDARRFTALGVPSERISVMGDARFDQVWERSLRSNPPTAVQTLRSSGAITLVAGSTWPPDEDRLVQALRGLRDRAIRVRSIFVPHEPKEEHLGRLESTLGRAGLASVRLSAMSSGHDQSHVIVDRVGILGDLYRVAEMAYVGGGFGEAGLHSVLEPAAFGLPVLFGPRHENAREAAELIEAGGAISVRDAVELESTLARWSSDSAARETSGERARAYVIAGLGAAGRGAEILIQLLDARR